MCKSVTRHKVSATYIVIMPLSFIFVLPQEGMVDKLKHEWQQSTEFELLYKKMCIKVTTPLSHTHTYHHPPPHTHTITITTAMKAQAEELKPLIEQAALQISAENTELACAFIQKTSMEKATPEMDKRLAEVSRVPYPNTVNRLLKCTKLLHSDWLMAGN